MIFAAGLGTRLRPFTDDRPKALVQVGSKTLLEHCIRYLQTQGIKDVVVNVHHFADAIIRALTENNGYGSNFEISDEREVVLETGGGLKKARQYFMTEEQFVIMNVDIMTNLNLNTLITSHRSSGAACSLAVMQRKSSRVLLFDDDMRLMGWENTATGERKIARDTSPRSPFAFSGITVMNGSLLADIPFEGKFSIIELFLYQARNNDVMGFDHTGDLLLDVGKPEALASAAMLFP